MNVTTRTRYRVVTAITPPFVMYNSSSGSFYGYCIDLLDAMRETAGFDYDIRESSDKEFGFINEAGEWTGLVKDLMMNTADFAAGPLWIMHNRRKVIDYTMPFYKDNGIMIMMRKPKDTTMFLWFLTILDIHVWLYFAIAFFVTSILIHVYERYSPFSYRNAPERYQDAPDPRFAEGLKECFWFSLTSLTPQGGGRMPRNMSGKLTAAIWWIFLFIIVAAYNANLAVYQALYRLERRIETIDDLRRQYQVDYSTIINSPTYRYFESMKDNEELLANLWRQMSLDESMSAWEKRKLIVWEYPVEEKYTKIYEAMKKTGFVADLDEAVNSVRKVNRTRDFAYVGEAVQIRYLSLINCDLKPVGRQFGTRPYAFAVKKGSPLLAELDDIMARVLSQGITPKLEKKWWEDNPEKADCSTYNEIYSEFTFRDMRAIFLLIPIGIFLACLTLCLQYCRYTLEKKRLEKKRPLFVKTRTAQKITDLLK